MEQTFYVTFRVEGRYVAEVQAESEAEARRNARYCYEDADFGALGDIDGEIVVVENEKGEYVWEK